MTLSRLVASLIGEATSVPAGAVSDGVRDRINAALAREGNIYDSPLSGADGDPIYWSEQKDVVAFSAARRGARTPYRAFFLVLPGKDHVVFLPRAAEALLRVYAELAPDADRNSDQRELARRRLTPVSKRSAVPLPGGREELWYHTGAGWVRITYDPTGTSPVEIVEIDGSDREWTFRISANGMSLEPYAPSPSAS